MPRTGIRRTGRGWATWEKALRPRVFDSTVKRHIGRATALNGKLAERTIRQVIRGGGFAANADLTTMIKGSSKPLVDNSTGLFQAITSQKIDEQTVFAGVLRVDGFYNIALALHEGATVNVTPAMRGMFLYLWKASEGIIPASDLTGRAAQLWERAPGGWRPLKASTTKLIIPGRPFINQAFRDTRMKAQARDNWRQALQAAMRELKNG